MNPLHAWSEDHTQTLRDMWAQGHDERAVSLVIGRDVPAVRRKRIYMGLPSRREPAWDAERDAILTEAYLSGAPIKAVARLVGKGESTTQTRIHQLGLKRQESAQTLSLRARVSAGMFMPGRPQPKEDERPLRGIPIDVSRAKRLTDLDGRECRYPVSGYGSELEGLGDATLFCAARRDEQSSYCPGHRDLCRAPA